jgi:hypothetical protein
MLALVVLIARRLPAPWLAGAALLASLCVTSDQARTSGELALSYAIVLAFLACAVIFCRWFARANYLAYALVLWAEGIRSGLGELLANPNAGYQVQGWIVLACGLAAVVWLVSPAVRREPEVRAAAA